MSGYQAIFGPAGHSESFTGKTVDAAVWLSGMGLTAFEIQCGHGVKIGRETAEKIGANMAAEGIALSIHSPYFINLSNSERIEQNIGYLRQCQELAQWTGASRIIVHTGTCNGMERREALASVKNTVLEILRVGREEGWNGAALCLETMGKINQLGDLDEVLELCSLDDSLLPCIDFGHLYARTLGAVNGREAFAEALDKLENALGNERARRFHMHFSRIEFSNGGEKKHRTFEDNGGFGPDWEPLAGLLAERGLAPTVICESRGTQAEDAVSMQQIYRRALNEREN